MATHYKTTGEQTEVQPQNGVHFSLKELQGYVGGWVEMIHLQGGKTMWMDEEGKLKGLPMNLKANILAVESSIDPRDTIVGDVLVCSSNEVSSDA